MERQSDPQLELFMQPNESQHFRHKSHNEFLGRIWAYEKTILILIGFLVTGIIAFSIGVEKGKRGISIGPNMPLVRVVPPAEAVKQAFDSAATQQQRGSFTIQVASFKTKANAQKEAENIKKNGLSTILLSKGGYIILCVGNFPNKETAQPLLSELNRRYGSCQIRRL